MLKLRRAMVIAADPVNGSEQSLRVQLAGEREAERAAIADVSLVGPAEGGALPGGHSRTVRELRGRELLAGHITAAAAFGGEEEAMTTAGAIHHGLCELSWDAVVCGPGPGIVGSGSALGHGGISALDSAHAALALGCRTLLVVRMSSADPRGRHRGISHHTLTVLDLLLEPVTVALPAGMRSPFGSDLRAAFASSADGDAGGGARSTLEVE